MEKLKYILIEFTKAVSKIHLLGTISDEIFANFPANLPQIVKDSWREKTKKIIFAGDPKETMKLDFKDYGFLGSLIHVLPSEGKETDFQQVILRQDLINYLAHLEAVMQDIQRFIFTNKPELLPEEKEVKWKEISDKKSVTEILDFIINKQLEKSGYDKLTYQIERLNNKPFLFKISIKKKELEKLDLLIAIRNLILHNGNRISNDYLTLNPTSSFKVGEQLVLTRDEINEAHVLIQRVAYESYASVGNILFGIAKETLYNEMSYNPER
ncbi:hypothetical protein [Foetidibacter luteolus]|uniref:hypothetical protein n=1 Tax=Foetidibacter luteolus TaxID=2608880 RepID=UPI00129A1770|nr:hypothetical protein [Foetidibacter luteolus]